MSVVSPQRRALAAKVAELRGPYGEVSYGKIAAQLGISRSYAASLDVDPSGERERARRDGYRRLCACGRAMTGSEGFGPRAPKQCFVCMRVALGKAETARRGTGPLNSKVLEVLRRHGECHRSVLAAETNTRMSTIAETLHRLLQYGLVERVSRGVYRPVDRG